MLSGRQFSIDPDLLVDVGTLHNLCCAGSSYVLCMFIESVHHFLIFFTMIAFPVFSSMNGIIRKN